MQPSSPRPKIVVRQAVTLEEQAIAGRVTEEAYQEFADKFEPDEWEEYARTLPDTRTRVEQGILLIAVDPDGEIVGTITYYPEPVPDSTHWRPDDVSIRFLAVRPGHRKRGVGTALIQACIDRALKSDKNRLAMQTTPHMTAAIDLYRRAGFVRDFFGDETYGSFVLLGYALVLDHRTVPPAPSEEPGQP